MQIVVVGAGFAGTCAAWMLQERLGATVTVLEQEGEPGGMLRTLTTPEGVPYEYGPRVVSVFRGTPEAIPFLRRFLDLHERQVYQGTRLRPEFPVIPFPVDLASLRRLPCGDRIEHELEEIRASGRPPAEESLRAYLESSVGPTLTELAFEGFNRKFWGRRLEDMPADWGRLRRLERIAENGAFRLPSTAPHYYPAGGFNPLFERMLAGFDLRLRTRVARVEPDGRDGMLVVTESGTHRAELVIATTRLDELFRRRFGPLEWRGYRIEAEVVADPARRELGRAPDGVPFAWVYSPWPETSVCRTTDFGVIHQGPRPTEPAVLLREMVDDRVPMYPVWWERERLSRYLEAAAGIRGLLPLGRLGLYKYVTMDTTLAMVERLLASLERYLVAGPPERLEILHEIRGGWQD